MLDGIGNGMLGAKGVERGTGLGSRGSGLGGNGTVDGIGGVGVALDESVDRGLHNKSRKDRRQLLGVRDAPRVPS